MLSSTPIPLCSVLFTTVIGNIWQVYREMLPGQAEGASQVAWPSQICSAGIKRYGQIPQYQCSSGERFAKSGQSNSKVTCHLQTKSATKLARSWHSMRWWFIARIYQQHHVWPDEGSSRKKWVYDKITRFNTGQPQECKGGLGSSLTYK